MSILGTYTLKVTDMEGRTMHEEHLWHGGQSDVTEEITVDVTSWSSGMYVVRFTTPLVVHTQQLVVQH